MDRKHEKEEHLERLWNMKEKGLSSVNDLRGSIGENFDIVIVRMLHEEGLVELKNNETVVRLTSKGDDYTRRLIRAHRIAERLLHDVMGGEFETGACEFEHTISPDLVDSICTLLGHPRECPHGSSIPEGDCCKRSATAAKSMVIPLTALKIGEESKIAYINCRDDHRLHKLEGLYIRPGMTVKVHQEYPAYVISCDGANIAIDSNIAEDICVWRRASDRSKTAPRNKCPRRKRFWRRKFGFGRGTE